MNEPWIKTSRSFSGIVKSQLYVGQHKFHSEVSFSEREKEEKEKG
jgi:hypothetical protein